MFALMMTKVMMMVMMMMIIMTMVMMNNKQDTTDGNDGKGEGDGTQEELGRRTTRTVDEDSDDVVITT